MIEMYIGCQYQRQASHPDGAGKTRKEFLEETILELSVEVALLRQESQKRETLA